MKYLSILVVLAFCPTVSAQCSNGSCPMRQRSVSRVATNNRPVMTFGMINRVVVVNGNCNVLDWTKTESAKRGPLRRLLGRIR